MAVLKRLLIKQTVISCLFVLFFCSTVAFAQSASTAGEYGKVDDSLVKGLEAYRGQDWTTASLMLRDAIESGSGDNDTVWYMMIMSQIYAGYYESALNNCSHFERIFADSPMKQGLLYHKGRVLHLLGRNQEASTVLADFCIGNADSPMYVSALFWLAECFYDECDFVSAESIYSMIVSEHSSDAKAVDAGERLEEIGRSERERKLLYLLKLTGEEYLSLHEDYDRLLQKSEAKLDDQDIELIKEALSFAKEKGLGIDEAKVNRLNKKLNQFQK